jgi:uncharacterized protein YggE
MAITLTPAYRAAAVGVVAGGLLIGAFALGTGQSRAAPPSPSRISLTSSATPTGSAGAGRITVSGTGDVTGTPNQLVLSMGVQVNSSSVGSALSGANQAVRAVTGALERGGVRPADIQTADLYVQPNYQGSSQVATGYDVSESLTATLNNLRAAGAQIQAAARAGGNATTVDGVSLNLSDTGALLAPARARAVADARAKATQYARAAGQRLGSMISVSEQTAPQPYPFFAANPTAAAGKAASVPISPGSQKLSVTVTVVYAMS